MAGHARWSLDEGAHEHVVFLVEGMHCAGCARNIERAVRDLPGVEDVRVNGATARVAVDWRGHGSTSLGQILTAVERAGFATVPLAGTAASAEFQREKRAALKRLALASLGMMQAMMYLGALYGATDISASMAELMRIAGMVIVTPVLFYSGAPFLTGAWRDLGNRRPGMDVPVALALLLAWLPSVVNTFRASGEVYFDSVGMFVFFLSAGRFIEMTVRHRGLAASEALARSLPKTVTRLRDEAREAIPVAELAPGDRFLVARGAVVAVDAELADGAGDALIDESMLTGESAAIARHAGERIRGGSVNAGAPLTLRALSGVDDSTLAGMMRLLERAQSQRPRLARTADRAASWFVTGILALAGLTAAAWWPIDPARAFAAALSVLVVTCPCALSLATPAAFAAAGTGLARLGVLVMNPDAIERLARIDTVVLDKTGTLTSSGAQVTDVKLLGDLTRGEALAIAAALERGSAHPLAAAFRVHERAGVVASDLHEMAGEGIEGTIGGARFRLGRRGVEGGATGFEATTYLGGPQGLLAAFEVGCALRPDARETVDGLRRMGLGVVIASGDSEAAVGKTARSLDVRDAHARLTPSDKLRLVDRLRSDGRRVFVIGDGINDGPVLAAADVSCAMGQGSAIAQSAADLLLASESLATLPEAVALARRAMRVVRQNLAWSILYNASAVPLAALGLVSPWLAALGMSLSSVAVVLNARRLATGVPR